MFWFWLFVPSFHYILLGWKRDKRSREEERQKELFGRIRKNSLRVQHDFHVLLNMVPSENCVVEINCGANQHRSACLELWSLDWVLPYLGYQKPDGGRLYFTHLLLWSCPINLFCTLGHFLNTWFSFFITELVSLYVILAYTLNLTLKYNWSIPY